MQRIAFIIALILGCSAAAAQALPPIVFYNYSPPQPAFVVVSVTPRDHQELSAPPAEVSVGFSETVDATRSTLAVYDQYNTPMISSVTNPKENTMAIALPKKLFAGTYRVEWKAVCGCAAHNAVSGTSYFTLD